MSETVKIKLLCRNGGYATGTIVDGYNPLELVNGTVRYSFVNTDGYENTVWVVEDEENPMGETWAGVLVSGNAVTHPTHYNTVEGMPEVWDILDAFFPDNPLLWNSGKYLLRAGKKQGNEEIQELEKMVQYAQRRIEKLKGGTIG